MAIYWFWVKDLNAVVVIKDSIVYQGPSKIYEQNGTLSSGSKVILSKRSNNWYYVRFPESHAGWVERSLLGFY